MREVHSSTKIRLKHQPTKIGMPNNKEIKPHIHTHTHTHTMVNCFDSVSHNEIQALSIPVLIDSLSIAVHAFVTACWCPFRLMRRCWTAIDRLSIRWKSDLTDKMKHSFFQAAVVSILLYGCTTWTQTKRLEKKLDGNYTRMLRAILNNIEQYWTDLAAIPNKASTIRPPASHHENYQS